MAFELARWLWLEISNRWMVASCLLLWSLFIVLMCATRVSPVNLVTMYAMVWTIPRQSPQVLLFLGCSQLFYLFYTLLFALDHQRHFCHHHLHPSQVLIARWNPFQLFYILNISVLKKYFFRHLDEVNVFKGMTKYSNSLFYLIVE